MKLQIIRTKSMAYVDFMLIIWYHFSMKNLLSTDDLIEKVAEFKEALQQLPQAQLDASIKDILSLTATEYWETSGLKDEMDFYFDE
jgi:hypothetical protein